MVLSLSGLWLPSPRNQCAGILAISFPRAAPPPQVPVPSAGMTSPQAGKPRSCSRLFTLAQGQPGHMAARPGVASSGHRWVGGGHSLGLTLSRPAWHGTPSFWRPLRGAGLPGSAGALSHCPEGRPLSHQAALSLIGSSLWDLNWHLTLPATGNPPPPHPNLYPDVFTLPSQLPHRISCVP